MYLLNYYLINYLKAQQANSLLYILWSYHTHSLRSVGKIQDF